MEEIFVKNAIILIGAMFAAIIAGYFSFINLIASKENKVSEFRQEWINSLRDSISCYVSSLSYLSTLIKHYSERPDEEKNKFEMFRDVENVYTKVTESYNDIVFRINDDEKNKKGKKINDNFLDELRNTREYYNKNNFSEAKKACDKLSEAAKPLLKYEWKRVKTGELSYRVSKYLSIIILLIGIALTLLSVYMIWGNKY